MSNEKFISPYIEFIDKNFDASEHFFYIIGGLDYVGEIQNKDNIKCHNKKFSNKFQRRLYYIYVYLAFYHKALKSKKIILHNLFSSLTILFLFFNPWFFKKSNWVMWGADLYGYRKRKYDSLFKKIYYKIEDHVKGNVGQISYLAEGDYNLAKEYFNVKGKATRAIYINPVSLKNLNSIKKNYKKNEVTSIQIGNSADPENNHIEILDELIKFKDENIQIYAPLSYGNKEYALKVKKYGEKLFGEKFIAMLDFFNAQKYAEYLSGIDILLFNHKRQQGLGNIFSLAYLEKKIYLRSDISSWSYLKDDLKLQVFDINNLKTESFESFKLNNSKGNKLKIKNTVYSEEYIKKIWLENFKI